MKFRCWCVTVMNNWDPVREFWTLDGALRYYREHRPVSHLFRWRSGEWSPVALTDNRGTAMPSVDYIQH